MLVLNDHYVAGLFDGEGYFHINKPSYQVSAAMTMRDRVLILSLQAMFGGSFRRVDATEKHAAYYRWHVSGEQASDFAVRIGPLLVIKRKQAQLCIDFQNYKRQGRSRSLTDGRRDRIIAMYEAMRELNRKGVDH